MGKTGKDIPDEDALDYVLDYTASNDISARTLQLMTNQWSFSQGLDGSCPIGPVLVSRSVIPDPQTLTIKGSYNGTAVQDGHTRYV
jgi:2-keto-4-pentenoate hydratase/2-oxohepta-3-ene-1,7-dioic acid hydratase in catechol pathway